MTGDPLDPLFLELQTAVAGRYSLEREVGRGGMGVVYLARDVTLDRFVAIKLLPPDLAARPGVRDRFLREARTAARLSHPNIVAIHSVEEAGRLVFFVMAYVPGQTLGARVRTGGPLTAADAGRILRDVAWALGYAHQQGVVHRDVKADNILLESPGRRTLVTDFGIAQLAGADQDAPLAGTVAYMSPEQARGDAVDGRSDLYALGVVGYLMLSGTLPYQVETIDELRDLQETGPPPPLSSAAPHAPRALTRAIDRCLHQGPEGRFQSADEFAAALDQLASGPSELPVPLRVWLTGEDKARSVLTLWSTGSGLPAIGLLLTSIGYGVRMFGPALALGLTASLPWLFFVGARFARTRKVLAAGYGQSDLVLAIKNQVARRREELAFEIGRAPTALGRWLRRITWTSLAVSVGMVAVVPFWFGPNMFGLAWMAVAAVAVAGALVGMFIPGRTLPTKERVSWREKLWAGPVGRFLVRVAGWRLGRRGAPEQILHRPTEIALGEAADALFRALPASHRHDLALLPEQIESLSKQAQRLRRQIEELDDLIADAAPATLFDGRPSGDGGAAALTDARDAVAGQLQETVALLESLRVGLLKLHAGTASPESITTELGLGRDLETRLGELARAHEDLDSLLGKADPPTPVSGAGAGR